MLATLAAFAPALGGGFVHDDQLIFGRNAPLLTGDLWRLCARPFYGDTLGYWRPLGSLVMWLGHTLGGAFGVHAVALLLHAGAAVVALRLGRRVLGDERGALLAALWFALHPVQVENVAWCAALTGPLAGLLVLLALDRALAWRDRAQVGVPWAAVVCCLLALLAKEGAVAAIPLVACALAWTPGRTGPVRWRALLSALGAALVATWLLRALVFADPGAGVWRQAPIPALAASRVVSAAPELLLRHLWLLLAPLPSTPFREFATQVTWPIAVAWITAALALAAFVAASWRRMAPALRLGVAFVLLPLLPQTLLFGAVGAHPVADRYLYLSVLGAGFVVAWATRSRGRPVAWLLLVAAAAGSCAQCAVWRDQRSLLDHALRCQADAAPVQVMIGDLELAAAQATAVPDPVALARANEAYRAAERFAAADPGPWSRSRLAAARLGLAWCLLVEQQGSGHVDGVRLVDAFERAVATSDGVAAAWVGLGAANGLAQRPAAAEGAFRRALELEPERVEAWFDLGYLQATLGCTAAARQSLQQALSCDPHHRASWELLARLR